MLIKTSFSQGNKTWSHFFAAALACEPTEVGQLYSEEFCPNDLQLSWISPALNFLLLLPRLIFHYRIYLCLHVAGQ